MVDRPDPEQDTAEEQTDEPGESAVSRRGGALSRALAAARGERPEPEPAEAPDETPDEPAPHVAEAAGIPPEQTDPSESEPPEIDRLTEDSEIAANPEAAHLEADPFGATTRPAFEDHGYGRQTFGRDDPDHPEHGTLDHTVVWGARWRESAQGWVEDDTGQSIWRPIVTTAEQLADWLVHTYLGVVAHEVTVPNPVPAVEEISEARRRAVRGMLDEAVARGAHAVISVRLGYETLGSQLLITAHGTGVTLRPRD